MMATRLHRYLGKPVLGTSASERVGLIGTEGRETIKASGQNVPRKKAGHMTATQLPSKPRNHLQTTGRPHMTRSSFAAFTRPIK